MESPTFLLICFQLLLMNFLFFFNGDDEKRSAGVMDFCPHLLIFLDSHSSGSRLH